MPFINPLPDFPFGAPVGGSGTPLPEPYTGWQVLAIDADDFGAAPRGSFYVKATIVRGAAPYSLNGQSFQADAVTYSKTGAELGLDPTAHPDSPTRRYLLLPPKSMIVDRKGESETAYRFDSNSMAQNGQKEAIQALFAEVTEEIVAAADGFLWKLLQNSST